MYGTRLPLPRRTALHAGAAFDLDLCMLDCAEPHRVSRLSVTQRKDPGARWRSEPTAMSVLYDPSGEITGTWRQRSVGMPTDLSLSLSLSL